MEDRGKEKLTAVVVVFGMPLNLSNLRMQHGETTHE